MSRRALGALPLALTLLSVQPVDSARACDRTGWVYDPEDVTDCVDVSYVLAGQFEFANHCTTELTLAVPDCEHCTVPATIASGQSGTLVMEALPTRERDGLVDLEWQTGDTSGTLTFTFPVNACPEMNACVVELGSTSRWPWTPLAALGLMVVVRRRARTR